MVPIKPHFLEVTPLVQERREDGTMTDPVTRVPFTLYAYCESISSSEALNADGVEYIEPVFVMCEVSDGRKVKPGYQVLWRDRSYTVGGRVQIFDVNAEDDHVEFIMATQMVPIQ